MEEPIWTRQPGESPLWFGRFDRFRLMWPHNLAELYRQEWREQRRYEQKGEEKGGKGRSVDVRLEQEAPREAPGKWYEMAAKWQWRQRAAAYDAHVTAKLEAEIEPERGRVLVEGFAQVHRRIAVLNAKAEQLLAMTDDPHKVWLPDVKSVGTGEYAQRVDLVQFNSALFHELRATLADIAAELGERVKKKELAITELPANIYGFDPDQDGVDDRDELTGEDDAQEGAPC